MNRPSIAKTGEFVLTFFVLLSVVLLVMFHLKSSARTSFASISNPIGMSSSDPALIYSDNPADPWNRIFQSLFTRTIKSRLSDAFSEGAPFRPLRDGMLRVKASSRVVDRLEIGDRPIDPLYPSFFTNDGVLRVLSEPEFTNLRSALKEALEEQTSRPFVARALMQIDAWAAYDILFSKTSFPENQKLQALRRNDLLSLLSRFIMKLRLPAQELDIVPDNYCNARLSLNLPDIFNPNGEWIEIQLNPNRLHDLASDFRRSARVFLKPVDTSAEKRTFLQDLRDVPPINRIDSLALVVQPLLIDENGNAVPTRLTAEVQIRKFTRDSNGNVAQTELQQFELSRRALLKTPRTGGFIEIDNSSDLYLPAAGNDYEFASPQFTRTGADYPVLVNLQQRCEGCHGLGTTGIFTFSFHQPTRLPPIALLNPVSNVHGWYVAGRKQEREDFRALRTRR